MSQVLERGTGRIRVVVPDAFDARYVSSGHLVFGRGETLLAAPFDLNRLELSGPPVVVAQVRTAVNNGAARYNIAEDGSLVYVRPRSRAGRTLAWVDAKGAVSPLPLAPQAFSRPSLSPDGTRVAVQIDDGSRRDIWIHDLARGTLNRLTSDGASEAPIWTPDGLRVTFSITKAGRREVYWQPVDGTTAPEILVSDTHSVWAASWSPDGERLTYTREPPTEENEIGVLDVRTRRSTMVDTGGPVAEHGRFSPDGRWLAYAFSAWGRTAEVFVSAVNGGGKRLVSNGGGSAPVWGRDARMLYYRSGTDYFSVDVRHLPSIIGRPTALGKDLHALGYGSGHPGYDVASDGRLLIVQPGSEEAAPLRLEIVQNWREELKQRLPSGR